ncbi:FtsX-like permease family protein [soil metagenome]
MARHVSAPSRNQSIRAMPAVVLNTLRRLRGEAVLLATVILVICTTSLVLAALPRLYNRMSDDGLVYDIEQASTFQRNLNAQYLSQLPPAGDAIFSNVEENGQAFLARLPASIQSIVATTNWIFDSPRYSVRDLPGTQPFPFERFMRFRYQSEIDDNIRMLMGDLPAPREPIPLPCANDCPPTEETVEVFEVAISTETATQLDLAIGEQLILEPDSADPQNRSPDFSALNYTIVIEVAGIFEILNAEDPYWFEDPRLQRADEVETPDALIFYATSLISPDDYERSLNLHSAATWNYNYFYYVDPKAFDAGLLDELSTDVLNAEFTYAGAGGTTPPDTFFLRTGLSSLFNRFEARQQQAIAVLALAAIGLLAVTVAVIGLLATLMVDRRRSSIALQRGRGASSGQLVTAQTIEGVLLAVPVALLGYVAALLLVDSRPNVLSLAAAFGMIVVTALLLVTAALPYFRMPLRELEETSPTQKRPSTRRIVVELTVVALAVAGVVLLRRRGLSPEGSTGDGAGFDPYLAAVPILLGLATGLAALRLYPLPIRFFAWVSSLRRDLVLFVGLRRVSQQAAAARLPLLVILLAVALAVFSSVVQRSIDDGQAASSWQATGADYRVEPFASAAVLSSAVDLYNVTGVKEIARAHVTTTNQLVDSAGRGTGSFRLLAIDTGAYQAVAEGTPTNPNFPDVMLGEQIITDIGRPTNPIPAIVSSAWPSRNLPDVGDTFTLSLRSQEVTFIIRDVRDRFAGIPIDQPFIVTSLDSLSEVNRIIQFRPNVLLISGEPGIEERLETTLDSQTSSARLVSREELYASVRDVPLISGVAVGFQLSVVLATICAALAAVVALALSARARSRDLAYLRTLGLSTNQALGLTTVEQLPPVLVAGLVGTLLGVGTARIIEPGVDLTVFTGPDLPATLIVNWPSIVLVAAAVSGVVTLAIIAFSLIARRANLGEVLRVGDR